MMRSCEDKSQQNNDIDSGTNFRKSANFDDAVTAAGWGTFHFLLYLTIVPALWATNFDTLTPSLIIPSAECDFQLTLFQKGVLNAAVYGGMVSSCLLWGFVADSFGRKPIIVFGYLLDGALNICSGLSQNFHVLLTFKLLSGFINSGPHASALTYCAEFHCTKNRPKIAMIVAFFVSSGIIVGAILALLIIPQQWYFTIVSLEIHSWQIYLIICGLIVFCAAICLSLFPESPNFLMSQGRNDEALKAFKKIYSINSCSSQNKYPVKILQNELDPQTPMECNGLADKSKSFKRNVHDGLLQMKSLFTGSYLFKLSMIVTIQFCVVLSENTIRLWQPQLFVFIEDSSSEIDKESTSSFCEIVDNSTFSSFSDERSKLENCTSKVIDDSVYVNVIIISAATLIFTLVAGLIVSIVNSKYLLLICCCISLCTGLAINWSKNMILTLVLISIFVGSLRSANNLVVSLVVNLFPTGMRTMAVSLTLAFGRFGTVVGNMLFPILLQYGCSTAIFSIMSLVFVAFVLALFVPRPDEIIE